MKRAVITVIGKDMIGILAKVSNICSKRNINIIDVSQTVLSDVFAMIMLVDLEKMDGSYDVLKTELENSGKDLGLSIHIMREEIFNSMHNI